MTILMVGVETRKLAGNQLLVARLQFGQCRFALSVGSFIECGKRFHDCGSRQWSRNACGLTLFEQSDESVGHFRGEALVAGAPGEADQYDFGADGDGFPQFTGKYVYPGPNIEHYHLKMAGKRFASLLEMLRCQLGKRMNWCDERQFTTLQCDLLAKRDDQMRVAAVEPAAKFREGTVSRLPIAKLAG